MELEQSLINVLRVAVDIDKKLRCNMHGVHLNGKLRTRLCGGDSKELEETNSSPSWACSEAGHQRHDKLFKSVEFIKSSRGECTVSEGSHGVVMVS